jgi:hypothetical protein
MKNSHLKHIKRIGILLCLLLVLCSAEYLIGVSNQDCSLALPSMPSKALQKKIKARAYAQRRIIRKKMEAALQQAQALHPHLYRQFGHFKYYTKHRLALCLRSASYQYKREQAVRLKKALLKKNMSTRKKLIRTIQGNQWLEQGYLCKDIELISALTLLFEQKDSKLKNKLEKVDEEARSIAKRLLDVQTLICNAEKERELQLTRAQRFAQRLVTGDLAFSTELFSVIPPAQPLDEI